MRHLRDLLHFGKRDQTKRAKTDSKRSEAADSAATLIIAGEPVPKTEPAPNPNELAARKSENCSESQRLADVVKAKQRDRWHPPELKGPEFGGLIERRGVDTRGLMPEKFEDKPVAEHRKKASANSNGGKATKKSSASGDAEESLESTGMFLAALDNSAITLADSGLFRIADDDEEDAPDDGSINPYNHRG